MSPSELNSISKQIVDPATGEISYAIPQAQWETLLAWLTDVQDVLAAPSAATDVIPWDEAVAQLREAGIDV